MFSRLIIGASAALGLAHRGRDLLGGHRRGVEADAGEALLERRIGDHLVQLGAEHGDHRLGRGGGREHHEMHAARRSSRAGPARRWSGRPA